MVQLICLIVGFAYLAQRKRVFSATPEDFPSVPPEQFQEWRKLELSSIDIFLTATWSTFVLGIVIGIASYTNPRTIGFAVSQMILAGLFLAGIVVSAVYGSKAARLRKKLGISMRSRQ